MTFFEPPPPRAPGGHSRRQPVEDKTEFENDLWLRYGDCCTVILGML